MPAKPPVPCRTCKKSTVNDNKYCDTHQDNAVGWISRKSAWQGKGSTRQWRVKRARILKRDRGLCVKCLEEEIFTQATEVDHILNKASGGTEMDSNLMSLCKWHHNQKTRLESSGSSPRGGTKTHG
jgi:5-methylcytosine-specific restriction protein A